MATQLRQPTNVCFWEFLNIHKSLSPSPSLWSCLWLHRWSHIWLLGIVWMQGGCFGEPTSSQLLCNLASKMGTKRLWSHFDVMHRGDIMVRPVDQKRWIIIICGDTVGQVGNPNIVETSTSELSLQKKRFRHPKSCQACGLHENWLQEKARQGGKGCFLERVHFQRWWHLETAPRSGEEEVSATILFVGWLAIRRVVGDWGGGGGAD